MIGTATKRRATAAVLILLALGLVLYLRFGSPAVFPQTVRLPDGSELVLLGATFGTNHVSPVFHPKGIADRLPYWLVARMPQWLVQKLKISPRSTLSSPEPTLGLWFELRASSVVGHYLCYLAFVDDSDLEMAGLPIVIVRANQTPGTIHCEEFTAFPRRHSTIQMRLYFDSGNGTSVRVSEIQFANPAFRKFPKWPAGSRTVRNAAGNFEATIRDFVVGREADIEPIIYSANGDWLSGAATFDVRDHGKIATNWHIQNIEQLDATGNRIPWGGTGNSVKDNSVRFRFFPALWPDDSAWKVRFEFARDPTSPFAPDELVTFRNVPVPAPDPYRSSPPPMHKVVALGNWQTNVQGRIFMIEQLAGANTNYDNPFESRLKDGQITAAILPEAKGVNVSIVSIVSNLGDRIEASRYTWSHGEFQFGTPFPTNATTVDITFAVHQSQFLEFMVKPNLVTTNQSHKNDRK